MFLGSGEFAVPVLEALLSSPEVAVVGVVSAPDRPAGRRGDVAPVPVAALARRERLTLLQPERLRAPGSIDAVRALEPSLGVLADYGQIVPPALLDLPAHGMLNVHPSLLPRHRGATPIPATILAGDTEAGVTVIRMDAGLDTGPIVVACRWSLDGTETAPQLEARAAASGAALVVRSLRGWLDGSLRPRPQDAAAATLTRPLHREDGRLDASLGALRLERQVRAYQPWPASFLETSAGRLLVWRASVVGAAGAGIVGGEARPGELRPVGRGLALVTAADLLVLEEVQLAGRRRVTGEAFLRGYPGVVAETVA